jgi:hypothetical protein
MCVSGIYFASFSTLLLFCYDLIKQLVDMKELETDVATAMKTKEQELHHIKADREEVTSSLKDVSLWLTDAELRLQDRIWI